MLPTAVAATPAPASPAPAWSVAQPVLNNSSLYVVGPSIGVSDNGSAIAAWEEWGSGEIHRVAASRYVPGRGWEAPVVLQSVLNETGTEPRVAVTAGGDAFVVWRQITPDWNKRTAWASRHVAGAGWEPPVLLSPQGLSYVLGVQVATNANGTRAVAAWTDQNGSALEVWARVFSPGSGWSAAVEIGSGGSSVGVPRVAVGGDGSAFVVWDQWNGSSSVVAWNRYDGGNGWGTAAPLRVNLTGSDFQSRIAADGQGNAIAVWYQGGVGINNVWFDRYAAGAGWGGAALLEENDTTTADTPEIVANEAGDFLAFWTGGGGIDGFTRPYSPGQGWGTISQVPTYRSGSSPSIGIAASGAAFIIWSKWNGVCCYEVWANHFEPASGWAGPERISLESESAASAQLGVSAGADAVAIWGGDSPQRPLYANRFGEPLVPTEPRKPVAAAGDRHVVLSWSPPADLGAAGTLYRVFRGVLSGNLTLLAGSLASTTFKDTNVTNGVTYFYGVAAANAVGQSAPSTEVSATPLGLPSVPTNVIASSGDRVILLNWSAPNDTGGAAVTGYRIYRHQGGPPESLLVEVGQVLSYQDSDLTVRQTYYYRVSALNVVGEGPLAENVSALALSVPSEPESPFALAGDRQVSLRWSAPRDDGGSAVAAYRVYRGTDSGQGSAVAEVGLNQIYEDANATNGVTYFYQVSALNGVGEGARSGEVAATPLGRPSAPVRLLLAAEEGAIRLSWEPPGDDGGTPVTGYTLYRRTEFAEVTLVSGHPGTSFADTSLQRGVLYTYQVSAVNAVGEGARSAQASASAWDIPSPPIALAALARDASVTLSWSPPADASAAWVRGYRVYRGSGPGGGGVLATLGVQLDFTDSGLTNGQTYFYQVAAFNGLGESGRSADVFATPATLPGAPRQLRAAVDARGILLTWQPPESTGGLAILGYRIYRGTAPGSGGFLAESATELNYRDESAALGTVYYYRVTARNPLGEGRASAEINLTFATPGFPPTGPPGSPVAGDAVPTMLVVALALAAAAAGGGGWAVLARKRRREEKLRAKAPAPQADAAPRPSEPPPASRPTYLVENVFLLYGDGRPIFSRGGLGADAVEDPEIVGSMLFAVQDFIRDAFKKGAAIDKMSYGEDSILLERGRSVILAATVFGNPDRAFREAMREAVEKVETAYAGVVEAWDGNRETFRGLEAILEPLWLPTAELTRADVFLATTAREVQMLSGIEFFQGFVRLKVAVVNNTTTVITGVTVDVDHNADVLRLHKVEPATYRTSGSKVLLGVLNTGEKTTIAYYFDPQICTSSAIDGTCRYKDPEGELHQVKMKARKAEVVCPLFFTREQANTAMLRRLVEEELKQFDVKGYTFREGASDDDLRRLFELMKSTVLGHDVQLVRSFEKRRPYFAEAWLYGKTQPKGYSMVIRAAVDAARQRAEFYASSVTIRGVTGLLAELHHTFDSALQEREAVADLKVRPIFDEGIKRDYVDTATVSRMVEGTTEAQGEEAGAKGGPVT